MRVAIVHDALPFIGGAEKVLMALLEIFPDSPVYTLVYNQSAFNNTCIDERVVVTSSLQKFPLARRYHRLFLPFYPREMERFDLSAYDLVFSTSYAAAHGVLTGPGQLHISYTHTPLRQAWHDSVHSGGDNFIRQLAGEALYRSLPVQIIYRSIIQSFKKWDALAAQRPDRLIASSEWIAGIIRNAYRRLAPVIYPPVDVERFNTLRRHATSGYYLAIARLEPHKRVELLMDAFNRLGYPLFIVGEGSQRKSLERRCPSNVHLLGRVPDEELVGLLSGAQALVHAAVEDFGIALVEAQAAGCPVITYGKGGALETVIDGQTGILYPEQSAECMVEFVSAFEARTRRGNTGLLDHYGIRKNALRFSGSRFRAEIAALVDSTLNLQENPQQYLQIPVHIVPDNTTVPSVWRTG